MANYLSAADISASGLAAERVRMQVIANNVANANTTPRKRVAPFAVNKSSLSLWLLMRWVRRARQNRRSPAYA